MSGPYFLGLGVKRKNSQNEGTTDEEDSENCENFFYKAKKRRVSHLDAEIIPKFDPGKKTTNVKGWLNKIDQLGDMYEWNEHDRIFIMQIRLRGAAREWYDDLEEYGSSWERWKQILCRAFPRSTDFVDRLEEMLARNKSDKETMTTYFHDKLSLIKKCGLKDESALSCLIRGLPVELRANAKAFGGNTAEELYYGFLSSLENYKRVETRIFEKNTPRMNWQRGYNLPKICYNCRKTGHESRECRISRCSVCQRLGHTAAACWHAASSSNGGGGAGASATVGTRGAPLFATSTQQIQQNSEMDRRRGTRQMQDGRVLQRPSGV